MLNDEGARIEDDLGFLLRRSAFSILCIALVLIGVFKRLQTAVLILCSVALSALGAFSLFRQHNVGVIRFRLDTALRWGDGALQRGVGQPATGRGQTGAL